MMNYSIANHHLIVIRSRYNISSNGSLGPELSANIPIPVSHGVCVYLRNMTILFISALERLLGTDRVYVSSISQNLFSRIKIFSCLHPEEVSLSIVPHPHTGYTKRTEIMQGTWKEKMTGVLVEK